MRKTPVWKLTLRPCKDCGRTTPSHIQICESCQEQEVQVQPTGDRVTFPTRW